MINYYSTITKTLGVFIYSFLMLNFVFADTCDMDSNTLYLSESDVWYNSSSDIAGFQFNVDGANVTDAYGGAAEQAGFMISSSASTVLGFSLSGATFNGCG